jgi:hypothetical protein
MSVRTTLPVLLLILTFAVSPLHAQYVEIYRLDNLAKGVPEQEAIGKLATYFAVSADSIKSEKAEYQASLGELYMAHEVAKLARSDAKTVMTEKKVKGWGELIKEKNLKMDDIRKDSQRLEESLKKTQGANR